MALPCGLEDLSPTSSRVQSLRTAYSAGATYGSGGGGGGGAMVFGPVSEIEPRTAPSSRESAPSERRRSMMTELSSWSDDLLVGGCDSR